MRDEAEGKNMAENEKQDLKSRTILVTIVKKVKTKRTNH